MIVRNNALQLALDNDLLMEWIEPDKRNPDETLHFFMSATDCVKVMNKHYELPRSPIEALEDFVITRTALISE